MNGRDVLLGVGLGAALAFVADPNSGRRRRALARNQMTRAGRKTRSVAGASARDVANRTKGMVAASRSLFRKQHVADERLLERVRARLGHASSHPRAIDVEVADGTVTLRGAVLAREVDGVIKRVRSIRGVRSVVNAIDVHESPENVPSLQGDGRVVESRFDILQRNWAPATRAMVAAGVAATGICVATFVGRR